MGRITRQVTAALAGTGLAAALIIGLTAGSAVAATPPPPAPGVAVGSAYIGSAPVLAYTAANGSVWLKNLTTGAAVAAGGRLSAAPSVIAETSTTAIVFGRGTDNALWVTSCTLSGCGHWSSLGGVITSKPGASVGGAIGSYVVFARGGNGAVWGRSHTTAGWGPWRSYGGILLSGTGPAAAQDQSGAVYVLVVGRDQQLYIASAGRTGFSAAGGRTTASPALTEVETIVPGGASVSAVVGFARATNGAANYHLFLASAPGWHSMGGAFSTGLAATTAPQVAPTSRTPTATFGLGTDQRVYQSTGTWNSYPPVFTAWKPVS
jgi:hypothetical protein